MTFPFLHNFKYKEQIDEQIYLNYEAIQNIFKQLVYIKKLFFTHGFNL